MRDLTRELGVGTCCGKCLPEAKATLSDSLNALESRTEPAALAAACFAHPGAEFAV